MDGFWNSGSGSPGRTVRPSGRPGTCRMVTSGRTIGIDHSSFGSALVGECAIGGVEKPEDDADVSMPYGQSR